jgi:FtsP/CotA-like multicopper oxidase with cupredoxin domain
MTDEKGRDSWIVAAVLFAGIALIASTIGVGFAARAVGDSNRTETVAATAAPATEMVHLSEFKIDPASVTIAAGGALDVMNGGSASHNLTIKDTPLKTSDVAPGGSEPLPLGDLAVGDYTMFCAIPGHEALGMTAALHVVNGGGTNGGTDASPPTTMDAAAMDASMASSIAAFPAKTEGLGAQLLAPKILGDGTKQFSLTAKVVKWEVAPGRKVEAWTFNGTVPGPTLKVNPGDKVSVVLRNELPESTAIHFHGLQTPNSIDGVPGITQDPIKPGETYTYAWTAQATPAVGMYHSHQDAVKQVPNGMAGAFLIGDEPVPEGVDVSQQQIMMLNDSGTIGLTLNGKSFPATAPIAAKLGDWIEVQYMNEGEMIHPMHLHGMPQLVIAKDGFPLNAPQLQDTVVVAPGERYTVLVHADVPGVWAWHCHILSHAESATGMYGMVTALIVK